MANLKVVFFASLRETLGVAETEYSLSNSLTVAELKAKLAEQLAQGDALLQAGLQASIDFEFARDQDLVPMGATEVAFFPPVTGG